MKQRANPSLRKMDADSSNARFSRDEVRIAITSSGGRLAEPKLRFYARSKGLREPSELCASRLIPEAALVIALDVDCESLHGRHARVGDSLLFRVAVAPTPLAIPPPASDAKLLVITALFRVSVPERFRIPPPAPVAIIPETCPPVIVTPLRVSAPPEMPLIAMIRKFVELPAIAAFLPLMMIGVTTTGRPLLPITELFGAVSEYVQPAARLICRPGRGELH